MASILRPTARNLARAARALCRGDIVALPSETVYGLAADALDAGACQRIFAAKGRPPTDPLIVHVADMRQANTVAEVTADALRLAERFWPGALTLVLPKRPVVPEIVTAGRKTVAVRCPAHPVFRAVLQLTGRTLAAPSANPFGALSPTSAAHVRTALGRKISLIVDGGPCAIGIESTILDLSGDTPRLLRRGAIDAAQLAEVLHRPVLETRLRLTADEALPAPGTLLRHYSPNTPLVLHSRLDAARRNLPANSAEAWVYFRRPGESARLSESDRVFWLSERGDTGEAAQRLFALLHELDRLGFQRIHIELAPAHGVGLAINDRLQRAAVPPDT